ncbi:MULTISPECIES: Asp23/Gls24 family envelope stress response protein [unclassified Enterococcus]|uniref:Asp23/Gls24 family envelope stress response protein n=1 Tax=unclassified Enterococcus TaxID=2608891 RepID=UPI001553DD4A|nr:MULTISPECIES: Asp23/Gls24 family envelope stress response protein [unclassified Enterococcus]MBS7576927.1 Asp23/Gls24 family envelope stress response protein [Enterococcus sp. MMGLQ5-2]MBS7584334.1 Asp23/Gls24 family envelope stress response protein [Enterococcus sp. MMGLQ5-1]NPD12190.1 Asp23/Gls24 family envelope stress response protein [Enterococcus sp. MMGLQ5-1]NPD36762.1 Asp23/Gls24 family envelope stress response protein [Enterococcus sp. MMGLQ5-2]
MEKTSGQETALTGVKGELTFDDKVIQKIIGIALESIDGLLAVDGGFFSNLTERLVNTDNVTSGIDVEVGKKQVAVDLDIVAEYGKKIEDIYSEIKKVIVKEVKYITNLEVVEVNVKVIDIKSKEQYEKQSVTVQDKLGDAGESIAEVTSKQAEKVKSTVSKTAGKAKDKTESQLEPRVE